MEQEIIEKINNTCPEDQGIFVQPSGIPTTIKGPVVYMRYPTGGMTGGGYHENDYKHPFTIDERPSFKVLDLVLQELKPGITYLQYKQVEELVYNENGETDNEDYYGNYTDYEINYVILEDLEQLLSTF
jgi:hypothetical protein